MNWYDYVFLILLVILILFKDYLHSKIIESKIEYLNGIRSFIESYVDKVYKIQLENRKMNEEILKFFGESDKK